MFNVNNSANESDNLAAQAARRVLRHLERSGNDSEREAARDLAATVDRWQAERMAARANTKPEGAADGR